MASDQRSPARRVLDPVAEYVREEAFGGFALLVGAAAALLWVNLLGAGGYEDFWHTELRIGFGDVSITEDLRHWVNDGLMALFFFLISLEIKRELVRGDLRDPKTAALPILAALGGVLLPVSIFLLITGGDDARGWGIPMATDAAFAIGVLAVLGSRVGVGVKLFLVTVAVVDDVAAICVIALAYTADLSLPWLGLAVALAALILVVRRAGVVAIPLYVAIGVALWVAMLESGVHATIAGVALGLLTPAHPIKGREVLQELEHRIHPATSLVVLPLFALANAGVELGGASLSADAKRVGVAVAVALVTGKFLGIAGASLAALKLRVGRLPSGVDLRGLLGAAALGGIGFTVSLFITPLAYPDPGLEEGAKLGILAGSVMAAAIGIAILAPGGRHPTREGDGEAETG